MTDTHSKNRFDSASIILSALAISAIGALFYNVLPLYLGTAQDFRSLGNREIGFISSAFFLGYNAVTLWAFFWIRRWNWRIVTWVALPVALLGLLAGAVAESYYLLLITTVVAGGGFAAIYGIGTTILADTSNPARWYGVKIAAEAFPGAILLFVLPLTLIPSQGFPGAAYGLVIAALVLSPLLLMLPSHGLKEREAATEEQLQREFADIDRRPIWTALFATFIFFSAASGMWAFIERMGSQLNFSAEAIGTLLSITLLFATGGSLLTAWLGERFGNVRPFYVSCLGMLVALALLFIISGFGLYAVSTCLLTFAIGMGIPFAVAEIAELDVDGRFIILSVPAIGMGAMVGPGVAGALADGGSFTPVLVTAGAAIILSMILMRYSDGFRDSAH